jgi:4-carboxymuconolactone decarboxylase
MRLLTLVCFVVVGCAAARRAPAQDRMPPIPADKLTEAQRTAVSEFEAARSAALSGPFVPLLRSPEMLSRARAMGDYLRFKSTLPPRLSEFTILLAARHWTQQYEWNVHEPLARKAGLRADIIAAVSDGRRPAKMADDEEALYALIEAVQGNRGVDDATYARAVSRFGEAGVIDAIGITGYYSMLAMVMNTARTALPDGMRPLLAPLAR